VLCNPIKISDTNIANKGINNPIYLSDVSIGIVTAIASIGVKFGG
jgi:hypothetical protein